MEILVVTDIEFQEKKSGNQKRIWNLIYNLKKNFITESYLVKKNNKYLESLKNYLKKIKILKIYRNKYLKQKTIKDYYNSATRFVMKSYDMLKVA